MRHLTITTQADLIRFCDEISSATAIAFDTEFVSEDTYRPHLCLIQVAAAGRLAIIDPLVCGDLTPFWDLLVRTGHQTIVHAGREEFRFCLHDRGQRPHDWFDVQIAAGMVGYEYPASYGSLLSKLLKKTLSKGETRTDWRRRPLSARQIEYALLDVIYLEQMRDVLVHKLDQLNRMPWLVDELHAWQNQIELFESSEHWRRVSGAAGLNRRGLAIVRELWRWRDQLAAQRDSPPKRLLRDDLIVELARRQTSDVNRIRAVRGMERRNLQGHLPELADCVKRAMTMPEDECPQPPRRSRRPEFNMVGQFLTTALAAISRQAEIAPGLVGTAQDVRDLIAHKLRVENDDEPPALMQGWRAEVVGQTLDDLLEGKISVRVADPMDDQPLSFQRER